MKSESSRPSSKYNIRQRDQTNRYYRHPNIISYKESFMEERTSTLCIVMEYADGGDLLQKIDAARASRGSKIPEATCWSYFIQVLRGL